ncbi:MAG: 16S rRNA (guanine(527)-N(7))-methyltransferase RsmG [Bacteroidota bacterium]
MHPGPDIISKYFPDLHDRQMGQFARLGELYTDWNSKINVISRKDIDQLYLRHILHSLAIAKWMIFKPEAQILDLGTGGGFPGIPLAIFFPQTQFHLIDGTGKKIRVCQAIIEELGLKNCRAEQQRAEYLKKRKYDFVVTRAVAKIQQLSDWSLRLITPHQRHTMPNGLIALKGRNLREEMAELPKAAYHEEHPLSTWFEEDFFQEKALIYLQY